MQHLKQKLHQLESHPKDLDITQRTSISPSQREQSQEFELDKQEYKKFKQKTLIDANLVNEQLAIKDKELNQLREYMR